MTNTEFDEKYKDFLEYTETSSGDKIYHSGLCFNEPEVTEFLDEIFQNVCTKIPNFKYSQIKIKFGKCRFYCNIEGFQFEILIEQKIDEILKLKYKE